MARPRSSLAPAAAWCFPNSSAADPGSRYIPYRPDDGTWRNAAEDQPWLWLRLPCGAGMDGEMTPGMALEDVWMAKPGHHAKDGIEVIDVQGEIDMYTAPRLRELLIDLVSQGHYQLVVNLDKVGFLDSTGLGVGLFVGRADEGFIISSRLRRDGSMKQHCWKALTRSRVALAVLVTAGVGAARAQSTGKVQGTVKNPQGQPINGAEIQIVGSSFSAKTNAQGYYFIENIPAGSVALLVKMIGYKPIQREALASWRFDP